MPEGITGHRALDAICNVYQTMYIVYKDVCTYAKYDEYTYGQYVVEYGVHMKLYEGP